MFQFNFEDNSETKNDTIMHKKWNEAEEIVIDDPLLLKKQFIINNDSKLIQIDNIQLYFIDIKSIINIIQTDEQYATLKAAENIHSDLIPSIYEGGLKVWECTIDLLNYLKDNQISFDDKLVLDLGCGHGLLGTFALKHNANVHFQDYNKEVIKLVTIPNIVKNANCKLNKCRFFSGDWESLIDLLEKNNQKYDYILTSETIYNLENYKKLVLLFRKCLNRDGIIFLSAKSYYFGVGGGTNQFLNFLKQSNQFSYEICWKTSHGLRREIIKICLNNN